MMAVDMNLRRDLRIDKRLMVTFGAYGFETMGMTGNISTHGLCIRCHSGLGHPPGERPVRINLGIYDDLYEIDGVVRWCVASPRRSADTMPWGLGIEITRAPEGYLTYVRHFSFQHRFHTC